MSRGIEAMVAEPVKVLSGDSTDDDEQDAEQGDDEDDEGRLFHGSVARTDAETLAEPEQGCGQITPDCGDDGARDGQAGDGRLAPRLVERAGDDEAQQEDRGDRALHGIDDELPNEQGHILSLYLDR